ncbi:hypothetical protein ACFL2T_02355 [Elusimicrobiota bacterium]
MGLLNKLFGSSEPAPPCAIHSTDRELVQPQDSEWWNSLSLEDCKAFAKEDDVFRLAAFQKLIEADGLSSAEAGKKVRLTSIFFYWQLDQRADEQVELLPADAKLPYVLKDRINRAVIAGLLDENSIRKASSVNAAVRELIGRGVF